MATLAGQRAQFTWALNQYNLSEDPETRAKFAKRMAKYIAAAPANGFTIDQVTQGQMYPASEVHQYLNDPSVDDDAGISEEQAIRTVEEAVDNALVARQIWPDYFHRHGAIQLAVSCLINRAHATLAQNLDDFISLGQHHARLQCGLVRIYDGRASFLFRGENRRSHGKAHHCGCVR